MAQDYADLLRDDLRANTFDRAVLGIFAEQVIDGGGGRVADLGCGPGRITGHLAGLGLDVSGIDLSPGMVEVARREHPGIPFSVGSMLDLPFGEAELAGALAWYSIIHIPQDEQDALFREFARVSKGAYARFDAGAAKELAALLRAVAAYDAGGRKALQLQGTAGAKLLLEQLR